MVAAAPRRPGEGRPAAVSSPPVQPVSGAVVWVPPGTPDDSLRHFPPDVAVQVIPADGEIPEHLGRGDVVIPHVRRSRLRPLLERLDGLRLVQTLSAGVDFIVDLVPEGVVLCDAAGVHDIPVAEWVLAAMLAMQRDLPQYVLQQRDAHWQGAAGPAREVNGMHVLVVGYGSIGRALGERLRALGAEVTGVALHAHAGAHAASELPSLLPDADAVVVLLPLTAATRGMVDAAFIARMKPGALLVNAGRGAVADTQAITDAVQQGRIRVALDVVDPEPLPAEHPLWAAPGTLITPHVAGSSDAFLDRAWRLAGDQVRRYVRGEPLLNVVREGY
jgi:phosphoglycerate dehydrogenase-like enzyme